MDSLKDVFLTGLVILVFTTQDFAVDAAGMDDGGQIGCDASVCDGSNVSWPRMYTSKLADAWGLTISGHLQQGTTTNSGNPINPPSGSGNMPATLFNYRNDEYMLNQMAWTVARKADNGGSGWDVGGQIDFVYGTDYIFLQSRGLETDGDFLNRWNSSNGSGVGGNGLMGLALPQLYLEVAYNDLTFTLGHFYEPLGYERPVPTENFYYSTSYGHNFGFETSQVTGAMVDWQANDQWTFTGGAHRGMLNWEDNNNDLNAFAGFTYIPAGKQESLQFLFDIGKEDDAGTAYRYLHSITFSKEIGNSWSYVIHSDFGAEQHAAADGGMAYWYNVVQWLAYQIDDHWAMGVRYEWFDDIDGAAVSPTPGPGVYHDITLGLNYKPNKSVIVRPEIRWDWFDSDTGVGPGPFANGTKRNQFMAAVDMTLSF
ncbi:hypothetical protein FF011L_03160 [Roseimaritima multifibrata]|uniref:Porin n=1 Tax=Roseimaritima multifibrata TaxID=1930274 RepID=A0A517M9L5_9BACT|nr:outer membrane beta-barrel protein [Roseimaritima multifibrata]QDS91586.1 hypothetical protein FF011L_03160 [Roseimaritima multifibrata]